MSSEIITIHKGPIYICKSCRSMLSVPENKIQKEEVSDNECNLFCTFYICPECNEKQIIIIEEIDENDSNDSSDSD